MAVFPTAAPDQAHCAWRYLFYRRAAPEAGFGGSCTPVLLRPQHCFLLYMIQVRGPHRRWRGAWGTRGVSPPARRALRWSWTSAS